MEVKATVKLIGEMKSGISQRTGNAWKCCTIMLELIDSEGTHHLWGTIFNDSLDGFEQKGIAAGNNVTARLRFTSRPYRTNYVGTDVEIVEINKINQ